jgi:hypothetical protein
VKSEARSQEPISAATRTDLSVAERHGSGASRGLATRTVVPKVNLYIFDELVTQPRT